MALTNNVKAGIDLPVYEFLRPNLFTNTANSAGLMSIPGGLDRFMYWYRADAGSMQRYDAYSDSFVRMAYPPQTNNTLSSLFYTQKGYCGSVISASVSGLNIAAFDGNQSFVGKRIRITKGPGKNQERTILSVSAPITVDRMVLTSVTNNQGTNAGTVLYTDTLKSMSANQYEGFECKVVFGTGYGQVRRILYNTNTSITLADPGLAGVVFNHSPYLATSPAANSVVLIQSSNITLDAPWDVLPTGDSQFEVLNTGKVSLIHNANSPFSFFEYDLVTQVIDYKTIYGLRTTNFATDYAFTGGFPSESPSVSAFVTSASSLFFADSANAVDLYTYDNYQVKILSGTGTGQIRHIVSTALSGYTIDLPWDVVPDKTSLYSINNNTRIIYGMGGTTDSRLYNYHVEYDFWSHHPYVREYGVVNTAYATSTAYEFPIPLASISRTGTQAVATASRAHLINSNLQTVTLNISGATDSLYNGTFAVSASPSNALVFQYIMGGTPSANATFGYTNTTTRFYDATKNWTTNQWVSSICYIFNTQTTQAPTLNARIINGNDRNSISLLGALGFTPSAGCRYFILPLTTMGYDQLEGLSAAKLTYGVCSTGALNSLTDNTKNWATNIHVNKRCLIIAGTLAGTEATITANTATTLTTAIGTPDTTSVYVILGALPVAAAGILLDYASNTTVNKGKYLYFNRGGTVPMYGQRYNVSTMAWETFGYNLFGSNASQQNTSEYPYGGSNGGECSVYDYKDRIYFNPGGSSRLIYYLDLGNMQIYNGGFYPYANGNSGYTGTRHIGMLNVEGLKFLYYHRCGSTSDMYRHMVTF